MQYDDNDIEDLAQIEAQRITDACEFSMVDLADAINDNIDGVDGLADAISDWSQGDGSFELMGAALANLIEKGTELMALETVKRRLAPPRDVFKDDIPMINFPRFPPGGY